MSSLAVKLPLMYSQEDGYMMIKSMVPMIQQNLKMLILTDTGERVMVPDFGVGIRRYLFENFGENVYSQIRDRVRKQARIFMPYITINNIEFASAHIDSGKLQMTIRYIIPSLKQQDVLQLDI
jgi:phage baseplate assembly protein W